MSITNRRILQLHRGLHVRICGVKQIDASVGVSQRGVLCPCHPLIGTVERIDSRGGQLVALLQARLQQLTSSVLRCESGFLSGTGGRSPCSGLLALQQLGVHAAVRIDAVALKLLLRRLKTSLRTGLGLRFGSTHIDLLARGARVAASLIRQLRHFRPVNVVVVLQILLRQPKPKLAHLQIILN